MANIQPFDYQKSTNIEEHNQIVNKVNEIVEVINNVNLDTINSEIATLQTKATETDTEIANIKNKDTVQDTEIDGITKNLVSNVTATFDNPSRELKISLGREISPSIDTTVVIPASSETGQYSAGNGITIQNYQIAVDTNVVALKTDIPDVPAIDDLTQRVTTLETEMPTKASVDSVNNLETSVTNLTDTVAGKVSIAQGVENSGKVLGIGPDGNVTPVTAGGSSGGGEVWEEIDLANFPTDWAIGDRFRVMFQVDVDTVSPFIKASEFVSPMIELAVTTITGTWNIGYNIFYLNQLSTVEGIGLMIVWFNNFNTASTSAHLFRLQGIYGTNTGLVLVDKSNLSTYVYKMWRCRAST